MEEMTSNMLTLLEDGLYVFWGVAMLVVALLILVVPTLRSTFLKIFESDLIRYGVVAFCFLIAFVHVFLYQYNLGGRSTILIAIGLIAGVKGAILLVFPSILSLAEKVLLSRYITGWLLVIIVLGLYLLNKGLYFFQL